MNRPRPVIHGRDHAEGGADPIPGLGDFLHWGTNDDVEVLGLTLNTLGGFFFEEGADGTGGGGINLDELGGGGINLTETGGGGVILTENGDGGIRLVDSGAGGIDLTTGASILIENGGDGGTLIRDFGAGGLGLVGTSGIFLNLPTSPGATGSLWNNGGVVTVA